MTPGDYSAITGFILACESFLIAGLLLVHTDHPQSARRWWAVSMAVLGLSAFLGAVDHGFVEPLGNTRGRFALQRLSWAVVGLLTMTVAITTAKQFFSARWRRVITLVALIQFAVFLVVVLRAASFFVVIINYAPVMLLLLACSIRHLRTGLGSWPMVVGLIVLSIGSVIEAVHVDVFTPIEAGSLYHIVAAIGTVFLYHGGMRFTATAEPSPAD